jgi:hypothetical protein
MVVLGSWLLPLLQPAPAAAAGMSRVASTAHAVYYAERGAGVDVRRCEAFLVRLETVFGAAPLGRRFEYHRHSSAAEIRALAGFPATGVTALATGRVDSVLPYHPHELVHVVTGRLGRPPALFSEGLAVALTSGGRANGRELDDVARDFVAGRGQLVEVLRTFALDAAARDYALAGSFVAFLLDRYGSERMVAFLRTCPEPRDSDHALSAAYGRSFATLADEWETSLAAARGARPWYDVATWPASLRGAEPLRSPRAAAEPLRSASTSAEPLASGARLLAEPEAFPGSGQR